MKKWAIALISLVGVSLLIAGCSTKKTSDQSWEKVKEEQKIVVATSGTLYPSSYYGADNKLTGYDVEVVKEVAKRLDLKVTFKEYNIDGQLAAVQKGTADFAANDYSNSKVRAKKFTLSLPIKYSFAGMVVRKSDDSGISSLEDLKGKKAAGEATTTYMKVAEKYGAELVSYDNATNEQYLSDVANGRTDVIVNDYYVSQMAVHKLTNIPVKVLENVYFNPSESGLLFKKGNSSLRKKINQELNEMKKDGTLSKISKQFFDADVSKKSDIKVTKTVDVQ